MILAELGRRQSCHRPSKGFLLVLLGHIFLVDDVCGRVGGGAAAPDKNRYREQKKDQLLQSLTLSRAMFSATLPQTIPLP